MLPARERLQVIHSLILRSSTRDEPKDKIIDYIAGSPHAGKSKDQSARLSLWILTALLLADGRNQIVNQASEEVANGLASPEQNGSAVQILFRELRIHNEKRLADESESHRRNYKMLSERIHRKEERLDQQMAAFRAQMASGREESRLEVRQDMLLAIGDVLQRAYRLGRSMEERLQDVIATLPTALQAGGAEALGAVGDTVQYNPRLHHSTTEITRGTMVYLSAPGVIVRGGKFGDRVILKASVTQRSEVNQWTSSG